VVGDLDGVIIVPAEIVDEVANDAVEMTAFEDFVIERVRGGQKTLGLYPPRGFSTFELILQIFGVLRLDAPSLVETGTGHLGSSSLRMIHRMADPRTGAGVARLSQFGVNLDLDARRPDRWPDDIRQRAAALVV
jgi:hypothetical protein